MNLNITDASNLKDCSHMVFNLIFNIPIMRIDVQLKINEYPYYFCIVNSNYDSIFILPFKIKLLKLHGVSSSLLNLASQVQTTRTPHTFLIVYTILPLILSNLKTNETENVIESN